MLRRQMWVGWVAMMTLCLMGGWDRTEGQVRRQITLKQQLEYGLKARRPQEFAFIDIVVGMVDDDLLPERTVDMAFQWARSKRPYPYQYFVRALTILAAQEGIEIQSSG